MPGTHTPTIQILKEGATATGTISVGVLTILQILPVVLGCVATLFGIILSTILIRNAAKKDRREQEIKEAILEDIKYRQENNLPVKKYE